MTTIKKEPSSFDAPLDRSPSALLLSLTSMAFPVHMKLRPRRTPRSLNVTEPGSKSNLPKLMKPSNPCSPPHSGPEPRNPSQEHLYQCGTCQESFAEYNEVLEHIEHALNNAADSHRGFNSWNCLKCKMSFSKVPDLERHACNGEHLEMPMSEKNYTCPQCPGERFTCKWTLRSHMKIEHSDGRLQLPPTSNFQCNVCQKTLASRQSLKVHAITHTGEKKHICQVCGVGFGTSSSRRQHVLAVHGSGAMAFVCDLCPAGNRKRFKTRKSRNQHRRIHTAERKYVCHVCERRFLRNQELTNHERIHLNVRLFPCVVCKRSFSRAHHLVDHRKTAAHAKKEASSME